MLARRETDCAVPPPGESAALSQTAHSFLSSLCHYAGPYERTVCWWGTGWGADLLPVAWLAVPGVAVTAAAVGVALHLIADLPWDAALALGAIVGATDPVAVRSIFRDFGAPRRLRIIVEAESLFNDGTALILFSTVVGAGTAHVVSPENIIERFAVALAGSVALGIAVGALGSASLARLDDALVATAATLIMAYGGYLLADHLSLSGPLETATAGLLFGVHGERVLSPTARVQARATWEFLDFLANSLLFLLMGLAVRPVSAVMAAHLGATVWLPLAVVIVAMTAARNSSGRAPAARSNSPARPVLAASARASSRCSTETYASPICAALRWARWTAAVNSAAGRGGSAAPLTRGSAAISCSTRRRRSSGLALARRRRTAVSPSGSASSAASRCRPSIRGLPACCARSWAPTSAVWAFSVKRFMFMRSYSPFRSWPSSTSCRTDTAGYRLSRQRRCTRAMPRVERTRLCVRRSLRGPDDQFDDTAGAAIPAVHGAADLDIQRLGWMPNLHHRIPLTTMHAHAFHPAMHPLVHRFFHS